MEFPYSLLAAPNSPPPHRPPSGPINRSGRYVEISGRKHSTSTAAIIRSTNGSVPQITSMSGISGATLRMTKIFKPTGGGKRPLSLPPETNRAGQREAKVGAPGPGRVKGPVDSGEGNRGQK